jgi:uncharacterized protein (UPF0332 family)
MSEIGKDKMQIIQYRLDQADETIDVVQLLIDNDKLPVAVNRIYYGVFYSLLALGLKHGFQTSKHLQLIGWFNREFIKKEKIEVIYGNILRKAYENRTSGDYDSFCEFEKEEVIFLFSEMKLFIERIKAYIHHDDNKI